MIRGLTLADSFLLCIWDLRKLTERLHLLDRHAARIADLLDGDGHWIGASRSELSTVTIVLHLTALLDEGQVGGVL